MIFQKPKLSITRGLSKLSPQQFTAKSKGYLGAADFITYVQNQVSDTFPHKYVGSRDMCGYIWHYPFSNGLTLNEMMCDYMAGSFNSWVPWLDYFQAYADIPDQPIYQVWAPTPVGWGHCMQASFEWIQNDFPDLAQDIPSMASELGFNDPNNYWGSPLDYQITDCAIHSYGGVTC